MHPEDQRRLEPWRARFAEEQIHPPLALDIELTDVCTHRCPWCLYPRQPTYLSETAVHRALEGAARLGAGSVIFTGGGEPLLHPRASEILEATRDRGPEVALFTNGEALGAHRAAVAASCSYVRISIDAGSGRTYARLHGAPEH